LTGKEGRSICEVKPKVGKRTLVVFGGPRKGLDEIYRETGIEPPGELINFVPNQGVESIRTEEAVFIVLSVLRYLRC
jgi:predicted SPOUT superfamily RNA methylase MTH1